MAILGHLICTDCMEQLCMGKWLRSEKDEGFGFWRGGLTEEESGRKIKHFLARHMNHKILVLTAGQFELRPDCADYRRVEDELDGRNPDLGKKTD